MIEPFQFSLSLKNPRLCSPFLGFFQVVQWRISLFRWLNIASSLHWGSKYILNIHPRTSTPNITILESVRDIIPINCSRWSSDVVICFALKKGCSLQTVKSFGFLPNIEMFLVWTKLWLHFSLFLFILTSCYQLYLLHFDTIGSNLGRFPFVRQWSD